MLPLESEGLLTVALWRTSQGVQDLACLAKVAISKDAAANSIKRSCKIMSGNSICHCHFKRTIREPWEVSVSCKALSCISSQGAKGRDLSVLRSHEDFISGRGEKSREGYLYSARSSVKRQCSVKSTDLQEVRQVSEKCWLWWELKCFSTWGIKVAKGGSITSSVHLKGLWWFFN